MTERPTIVVVSPRGITVRLNEYITGREKRALTNVFLTGDLTFSANAEQVKGLKGSMVEMAEDLAIRSVVVSVDGKTDDIVNEVLNLHAEDYAFVIREINKITADLKGEEVKKN